MREYQSLSFTGMNAYGLRLKQKSHLYLLRIFIALKLAINSFFKSSTKISKKPMKLQKNVIILGDLNEDLLKRIII